MKERREALMILLIGDKWSLFYNKHNDDLQYGNSKIDRSKYVTTTIDENGKPNLSPFSFFNVFSSNPPILVFSPARRVRNNTT